MRHFLLICFLLLSVSAQSQVVINEFCASNDYLMEDEFGDSSDWIEIYNGSNEAVNLEGWFLGDNDTDRLRWSFPSVTVLPGGFLLLFASGRDVQNVYLHTNFKLSAAGETICLSNPAGELIDHFYFFDQNSDVSLGRLEDGASEWGLFNIPTPQSSNSSSVAQTFTASPEWMTEGQNFETTAIVTLQHDDPNAMLYFTRDGRLPTTSDEHYVAPISIDTTTALRVMAISPGQLPSPVLTRTFFIGTNHVLPVISVVGDPDKFWSWEEGIFVDGGPNAEEEWPYWGSNYWSNESVSAHIEYLTEEGDLGIALNADIRMHGGRGARPNPMKPFRILAKKKYGSTTFSYPFFENRERTTFSRLVVRNASGDYNNGHFRDAFLARYFINEGLDLDVLAHRPVIVYLNGVYYGVENLREKSDEYYLKHNYGVDIDELDLLEEDTDVVTGNFDIFDEMYDYVLTHDLSQESEFEQAAQYFDVENIAEGFIVQTALNNTDWLSNNIKFWRERKPDAKWRYLIFDMDIAMARHPWSNYYVDMFGIKMVVYADTNKHVNIFKALIENENYKNYFLNRYADILNTVLRPEILSKEVDRTVAEIEPEMHQHFDKWIWPGFDTWRTTRLDRMYDYLEIRPGYARDFLRDYFHLPNEVNLKINTFPPNAGTVNINTIELPDLPWDGIYFNGVPVTMTINPAPGFVFSHWESKKTITTANANTTITYNFETDDEIVAVFEHNEPPLQLKIINPVQNTVLELELTSANAAVFSFQLFDIQGRQVKEWLPQQLGFGEQQLTLDLPDLPGGTYLLYAQGDDFFEAKKVVLVR